MGKVYSPEEVWDGHLPEQGTHQRTATELMRVLEDIPGLYAATLYGSTALGHPNKRSDVDVAVVYDDTSDRAGFYEDLIESVTPLPYSNLVEFHLNSDRELNDLELAKETDAFMVEHFRLMAKKSVIPGIRPEVFETMAHPFEELPPAEVVNLAEIIFKRYLRHKERRFFEASRPHSDEINYARLQRAFELPTAITRKLVRLQQFRARSKDEAFELPPLYYERDQLASRAEAFSDLSPEWTECSRWLIARDREYTELLSSVACGDIGLDDYEAWLRDAAQPSYQKALRLSIAAGALYQTIKLR